MVISDISILFSNHFIVILNSKAFFDHRNYYIVLNNFDVSKVYKRFLEEFEEDKA